MSLSYIRQQFALYGGFFLIVTGIIGNGINILVFASARNYRTTPCTFYFLIASIYNIGYITIDLISGVISLGFGIDLTRTSTSWCKIRTFFLFTLSFITVYCSCLATIDQYFATSQSAYHRRFNNIKWAHRIVIIISIIWFVHGIPYLLFYNISTITSICVNTDTIYPVYASLSITVLLCAVPAVVIILFGYLTFRNIQLTRVLARQQTDRQLLRMTFIQVLFVVICYMPYGIITFYLFITSGVKKDANRLMIESFTVTVCVFAEYFYCAGSCYMFLISSSRFRRATKDRLFCCLKPNQVIPSQQRIVSQSTLRKRNLILK